MNPSSQSSANRLLGSLLVSLFLAFLASLTYGQDIDEAYVSFVYELESRFAQGDSSAMDQAIDLDRLIEKSMETLGASEEFESGFIEGVRGSFILGNEILSHTSQGGSYRFLRFADTDEGPRARFRFIGSDNSLNYHELVLDRDETGVVRIIDIFVFMSGELLSDTFRRFAMASMPKESLLSSIFGRRESAMVKSLVPLQAAQEAMSAGDFRKAYDGLRALHPKVRDNKTILLMALSCAKNLDDKCYLEIIDTYIRKFPNDPTLALVQIDAQFIRNDFASVIKSIKSLEQAVGRDPYLELLRGSMHTLNGEESLARSVLESSIEEGKAMKDAYWNLVSLALNRKDHKDTARLLSRIEWDLNLVIGDLTKIPSYSEFAASKEHTHWISRHEPPQVPRNGVLRPTLKMKDGLYSAGTAFVTTSNKTALLMTAHHLFGEAGGMTKDLSHKEAIEQFIEVEVIKAFSEDPKITMDQMLTVPEAAGDVAAFVIGDDQVGEIVSLPLSKTQPNPGDSLWLLAQVHGEVSAQDHLHRAAFWGINENGALVYIFDADIELRATSGAAILNRNGEVVGIHVGGFVDEDGVNGLGHPVDVFAPLLSRVLSSR